MKCAILAIALLVGDVAVPVASTVHPNDTDLRSTEQTPDLSGTYVRALQPATCSLIGGVANVPALYVAQSDSTITLLVFSTRSNRMLRIERRESGDRNLERRNGLARWNGNELIVETMAPAFPLWDGPHAVMPGSRLKESFVPTPDDGLLYRMWYAPPDGEPQGPYVVRLAKCRTHR